MASIRDIGQIKFRFGAPTVNIILSDAQIEDAFIIAKEEFEFTESTFLFIIKDPKFKRMWIKKYALAVCKEIVARIQMQYQSMQLPGGIVINQDAPSLLVESFNEKLALAESFEKFVLLNENK